MAADLALVEGRPSTSTRAARWTTRHEHIGTAAPSRRVRRGAVVIAIGRIVLLVVGLALVFLLGAAFARTLDDRPKPGRTETVVRTLTPLPQDAPARTVTVTVTVTGP